MINPIKYKHSLLQNRAIFQGIHDFTLLFLSVQQEVTYSGTSGAFFSSGYPKTKVTQDEVARVQLGTIEPRVLYRPGYLDMRVPSLPPSKIEGCRWINVLYYILVKYFIS